MCVKTTVLKAHQTLRPLCDKAEHGVTFAACTTEFVKVHELLIGFAGLFLALALIICGLRLLEAVLK